MRNSIKKMFAFTNIKKFPLTTIFILIFAILFSINDFFEEYGTINKLTYFTMLSILLIINTLFVEISINNRGKKILGYILAVILALILNNIVFSPLLFSVQINTSLDLSINMLYLFVSYILAVISLNIFMLHKKSKLNFYEYCNNALNNLFKTFICYVSACICLFLVFMLLDSTVEIDYKFPDLIYSLLFTLYLIPNIILSFINVNIKVNNLYKGICLYCILPITMICLLIIYFYIGRLLLTKQLPTNLIFMLVFFVFMFGMISYFAAKNVDNKISKIYSKIFSYLFILPVLLQSYSLFIRISEYGLTPDRYISCMVILFEVLILFFLVFKNGKKISNVLISIIIICIVINIPILSLNTLSNISQKNIVEKYYKSSGENYYKAINSYKYLLEAENGKKYISDEVDEVLSSEVYDKKYYNSYKTYLLYNKFDEIDISDYDKIKEIKFTYQVERHNINDVDIINVKNNDVELSINLEKYVNYLTSNNYLNSNTFKQNNIIRVDEDTILYLDYLCIRIYVSNDNVKYTKGTGYLLEK